MVVAPGGDGLATREEIGGVRIRRYRYAPRRFETLAYSGTMIEQTRGSLIARLSLAGLVGAGFAASLAAVRSFRPAVVHAHWWFPAGLVGSWLAKSAAIPLVTTLHGSDIRAARTGRIAGHLFRQVLHASDAVTTVSTWLAEEARRVDSRTTPLIAPMPVAATLFFPANKSARDRLLFIGKLNTQKGIVPLLTAMAAMRTSPTLDIVCGTGSDPDAVRSVASSLRVSAQLRFHPQMAQAELARLYRDSTALVAPMVEEGLGLVAIEAALSGIPVVAFDSGGLRDIVVHEETGILVPAGDANALATALDDVLMRPDQGRSLGEAARRRALDTFAPSTAARRYAEVYRDVLAKRQPRPPPAVPDP
ncbi:MAG: hypothetical protein NVS4B3_07490 [Gemmatimonadaceae bacterium]